MRKQLKKIIATVLTATMAMSISVPVFAAESSSQNVATPYDHVMDSKLEAVSTDTQWVNDILVPGQATKGEIYPIGSFIYVSTQGGSKLDVSVSFSFGRVSVSIDPGFISSSAGGRGIIVETDQPCLLYVDKQVECTKYALYERLLGTSGDWDFVGYRYITKEVSYRYHVEEV